MSRTSGRIAVPWVAIYVATVVGCGVPQEDTSRAAVAPRPVPSGPAVVNDAWQILKMATAHGVFTIELEMTDLGAAAVVARELVDPLMDDYAEVLVYVYRDGRGVGGHAPAKRIQWTATGGFVELAYEASEAPDPESR